MRFGAVRYAKGGSPDPALAAAAAALRAAGVPVAGYVQSELPESDTCCATMLLTDLSDGATAVISQALGKGARGCKLDPAALADAAGKLQGAASGAGFLILNRFGKSEAEGGGFRDAIAAALYAGVPVLIAVEDEYDPALEIFAPGLAYRLPAEAEAVAHWALAAARG